MLPPAQYAWALAAAVCRLVQFAQGHHHHRYMTAITVASADTCSSRLGIWLAAVAGKEAAAVAGSAHAGRTLRMGFHPGGTGIASEASRAQQGADALQARGAGSARRTPGRGNHAGTKPYC